MSDFWQFWIDVGGTFTDCIGRSPDGKLVTVKTLSSGVTQGVVEKLIDGGLQDSGRSGDIADFWTDYRIQFFDGSGDSVHESVVESFDPQHGLRIKHTLPESVTAHTRYELRGPEEAPVLAIRLALGLPLSEPIPLMSVRLGTTRGTNALLERKGARTALVTTRGFGDVLLIGNQDRPRLFDLAIRKPSPLFSEVVEIDERIAADGTSLRSPDEAEVRRQLNELHHRNIDSIAICLLHAYCNPAHEEIVARIAQEAGFDEVSVSSAIAPRIKLVSRGDTTVLDAYLNPVLRQYVGRVQQSLGEETALKLMTSAGGLLDARSFRGSESILSGPAGGVVGFANVATQAGFPRAIGFDMGGTSTDVSRYDGRFELEYETQKAGVRIMTPTLAIETVAAGGGSLCQFDGVKLAVGPESAGANPGPACYGRGGPLTVTDVNLFLGRIPEREFPFPLDQSAVERQLQSLCDRIADSPLGRRYTPTELAGGFVDIANANMARAIRRISVGKGYDPADYVLVTFGGAGGQHACAIAKLLGIWQILLHPFAGILSAYGIGLADVRRHREASVLKRLDDSTLSAVGTVLDRLEHAAIEEVIADGIPKENITSPVRSLDLRYEGIESTINIPQPEDNDYRAAYEAMHEQMFGYRREGRAIEVVAARVEVVGETSGHKAPEQEPVKRFPQPTDCAAVTFEGIERTTGIFHRAQLHSGDEIVGPAIVCEPTSTVVIDPGFAATVTSRGELLISDTSDDDRHRPQSEENSQTDPDPARLEIFNNQFASIAEQMGVTLQKTALSTNVKERLDFSCAVFDADGGLVVNAPHIPVHLGAMSETVKRVIVDNPDLKPGDVIVTNDPYRGGSHLPDVTVVTPVHDADGRLQFLTASRAHHAEIGGITPGSMPPFSKNLAEEGVLIRNFKLIDAGESRMDDLASLLVSAPFPSRNVQDNLADITAQVAANRTGARLLDELVSREGIGVTQSYMRHIQRAAAEKMRLALSSLDDGVREFIDHLDDGSPISVSITISGNQATVDFTGTGPVLSTNLNANRAIVTAAVMYVFRCLIGEDIPLNSGVLEPIDIVLPECLLNPPEHDDPQDCAAIVGGNVETSQRVVDVLLGALGIAAASQGTMNNLTFGDDTFGYYETICGGAGATADADGADAVHTHMTNTRLTDVEVLEHRYPVRVEEFSIRKGSGGQGKHTGGDGITRRLQFLKPVHVSLLSQRRGPYAPFGLNGGEPGRLGCNTLVRGTESSRSKQEGRSAFDVCEGDTLEIETPGGGGFGPTDETD